MIVDVAPGRSDAGRHPGRERDAAEQSRYVARAGRAARPATAAAPATSRPRSGAGAAAVSGGGRRCTGATLCHATDPVRPGLPIESRVTRGRRDGSMVELRPRPRSLVPSRHHAAPGDDPPGAQGAAPRPPRRRPATGDDRRPRRRVRLRRAADDRSRRAGRAHPAGRRPQVPRALPRDVRPHGRGHAGARRDRPGRRRVRRGPGRGRRRLRRGPVRPGAVHGAWPDPRRGGRREPRGLLDRGTQRRGRPATRSS